MSESDSEPTNPDANSGSSNPYGAHSVPIVSQDRISSSTRRTFQARIRPVGNELDGANATSRAPMTTQFFTEFRGPGPPALPAVSNIGDPGDIYIDTEAHQLYARYTEEWKLWPGPTKNTLTHPIFPARILWWISVGHSFGWVIKRNLRQKSIADCTYPPASDIVLYIISPPPAIPQFPDGKRKYPDPESRRLSKKRKLDASTESAEFSEVGSQIVLPTWKSNGSSVSVLSPKPSLEPELSIKCFPKFFMVENLPQPLPPGYKPELAATMHHINYSQYRSHGPPPSQLGAPGDLYIDCSPQYRLFIRKETNWVQWQGMGVDLSKEITHPYFSQHVIYAGLYDLGWSSWSTVMFFRRTDPTPHQCISRILSPFKAPIKSDSNHDHETASSLLLPTSRDHQISATADLYALNASTSGAVTLEDARQSFDQRNISYISHPTLQINTSCSVSHLRHDQSLSSTLCSAIPDVLSTPRHSTTLDNNYASPDTTASTNPLAAENTNLRLELEMYRDENAKLRDTIKNMTSANDFIENEKPPALDIVSTQCDFEVMSSAVITDSTSSSTPDSDTRNHHREELEGNHATSQDALVDTLSQPLTRPVVFDIDLLYPDDASDTSDVTLLPNLSVKLEATSDDELSTKQELAQDIKLFFVHSSNSSIAGMTDLTLNDDDEDPMNLLEIQEKSAELPNEDPNVHNDPDHDLAIEEHPEMTAITSMTPQDHDLTELRILSPKDFCTELIHTPEISAEPTSVLVYSDSTETIPDVQHLSSKDVKSVSPEIALVLVNKPAVLDASSYGEASTETVAIQVTEGPGVSNAMPGVHKALSEQLNRSHLDVIYFRTKSGEKFCRPCLQKHPNRITKFCTATPLEQLYNHPINDHSLFCEMLIQKTPEEIAEILRLL